MKIRKVKMALVLVLSMTLMFLGVSIVHGQVIFVDQTANTFAEGEVLVSGSCTSEDVNTSANLFFESESDAKLFGGQVSVGADGNFATVLNVPEGFRTATSSISVECEFGAMASTTLDFFFGATTIPPTDGENGNGTTTPPGEENGTTTPPTDGENGATTTPPSDGAGDGAEDGVGGIGDGVSVTFPPSFPVGGVNAGEGGSQGTDLSILYGAALMIIGLAGIRIVRRKMGS